MPATATQMQSSAETNLQQAGAPQVNAVDADNVDALTGAQKSAVLLIALGVEAASEVLKRLEDQEVETISIEIARMRNISSDVVEQVLLEYREMAMAQDYIAQGGVQFARETLEEALGPRRAEDIIMRVEGAMEVSAFHLLQTVETDQLISFLKNEHPQTAALIVSHLNSMKAGDIISEFDEELQTDILYRLATMSKTSPEMIEDIEDVIRDQLGSVFGAELSSSGGAEKVADILNLVSRSTERHILEEIEKRDPDLYETIKRLMFVFEDLTSVHDRDLQRLLTEVDQEDMALALKAAPDDLKEKVLSNVSQRVADGIQEDLELMGPVRVAEVEEAQRNIIDTAQSLEEDDEITLSRSSEEMIE